MHLFRRLLFVSAALIISTSFISAQVQKYSRVKIYTDDKGLNQLLEAGVGIDHGEYKKGQYFISDFSANDISILQSLGTTYEIVIDDVSKFYVDQNNSNLLKAADVAASGACAPPPNFPTPANFKLGSMGGFYTYAEILAQLDTMAAKFPTIFKARSPISATTKTVEGRDVYWVKISDNPNVDENEPEVLYTALHHAREPASAQQVIMYMYYLLENYSKDPQIKYLVDNTEMYFVPCVNPDGYLYNQSTNPNGGGMFRKNRRDNGDGTFGVDINRNYGLNFGYDNTGSSINSNADNYRGPSGFSEPETQIMKEFCEAHTFKIAINYHTYSDVLIYPWGYKTNFFTPDSNVYKAYGALVTQENGYIYGTPNQTVGYVANGSSDDWMYGEQNTKAKIMAMSAEAGLVSDGFWPAQSRIVTICKDNIAQNLHIAQLATKYAIATDGSEKIVSGLNNYLMYNLQRLGLDSPATFVVSLKGITANVIGVGGNKTYGSMKLLEQIKDSISYTLAGSIQEGDKIKLLLSVDNGAYTITDTLTKVFGTPVIAYSTNGNSLSGWSTTTWGLSSTYFHSAPSSITDSPSGNYPNKANTKITQTSPVNLTDALYADLNFWTRWDLEQGFDYVEVSASSDNGSTWSPLCGKYTKKGSSNQDPGNPIYDGLKSTWVKETMSLGDYLGKNILVKFNLVSDQGGTQDGFYFDDLDVTKITSNPQSVANFNGSANGLAVRINPNPACDVASIEYALPPGCVQADVLFFDALGRVIGKEPVNSSGAKHSLDIQQFKSGIYFYQLVSSNQSSAMQRMVVVK